MVTKRTKADVSETLDYLRKVCASTHPCDRDKWLVTRAAEEAMGVAAAYAMGAYDDSRFTDEEAMAKELSAHLSRVVRRYREHVGAGFEPWEEA